MTLMSLQTIMQYTKEDILQNVGKQTIVCMYRHKTTETFSKYLSCETNEIDSFELHEGE